MKISDIDRFFQELDNRSTLPLKVLITGGAAAVLFGGARSTQDIDFEVAFKLTPAQSRSNWPKLQQWLEDVSRSTGISPEYSDDIERWSSIALPQKKSKLYKKIGKIEVRVLDPGLWAIGKLARFLNEDVRDMVHVFSLVKTFPIDLARLWGTALGMSPPSPIQSEFRRHVDHFFDAHAVQIWGRKESPEKLKEIFMKAAQKGRAKKVG
ncbi:MAG: hypothetical protein KCHDKBKB_01416 [Elusimicrobia bacterium]|nr:hypothetical protein [Elusimicrobiota bacterium]